MAQRVLGSIEPYDVKSNDWTTYLARLDQFFVANKLTGDNEDQETERRATFLTLIGSKAFKTAQNLMLPTEIGEARLTDIRKALTDHFAPAPLQIAETVRFSRRYQEEGETIAQYLATLRHLSQHCAFPDLDRALRDQFVSGLRNVATQQKLLGEKNLTLAVALRIATAMEAVKKQAPQLRVASAETQETIAAVQARVRRPRGSSTKGVACYRCGKGGHAPDACWHKDETCIACKKKGHLKNVYRSKQPKGKTHHIATEDDVTIENENADDQEVEYWLHAIKPPVGSNDTRLTVTPTLNGKRLEMELDTGAAVSIVSRKTWVKCFRELPLKKTNITLTTYSNENLKVLGRRMLTVKLDGQKAELPIIVVDGSGPPLFGRNWLAEIKLDWNALKIARITGVGPQTAEIIKGYTELFGEDLGTVKGFKASLKLKPEATPTFLKARLPPYALRDAIGKQLDLLERRGVMTRVSTSKWAEINEDGLGMDVHHLHIVHLEALPVTSSEIAKAIKRDPTLAKVLHHVEYGWPARVEDELKPYFGHRLISVESGCLMWGVRVIVPKTLQARVLQDCTQPIWEACV
eukprot:m.302854 g.302854  ORF g.302854 m.302854 type:complete len:578 (+) comp40828_c0_seq12:43-1776(+)